MAETGNFVGSQLTKNWTIFGTGTDDLKLSNKILLFLLRGVKFALHELEVGTHALSEVYRKREKEGSEERGDSERANKREGKRRTRKTLPI